MSMETAPETPPAKRRRKRRKHINPLFLPRRFTARAKERFARERARALLAHLGGEATISEQILASRAIRCEWDLLKLDNRLDADGELSEHALRVRAALENRLRLHLRDLGLKAPPQSPDAAMAAIRRRAKRRKAEL